MKITPEMIRLWELDAEFRGWFPNLPKANNETLRYEGQAPNLDTWWPLNGPQRLAALTAKASKTATPSPAAAPPTKEKPYAPYKYKGKGK